MDIERIEAVARVLRESSRLTEIEVRDGGTVLRLRRPAPPAKPRRASPEAKGNGQNGAGPSALPVSAAGPPAALTVTSHLVGVFRANRPAPVSAGDAVAAKQVIGHIEAMRLMNDCVAPSGGRVRAVLVEDGQPVEYGQPLFEIAPEEAS